MCTMFLSFLIYLVFFFSFVFFFLLIRRPPRSTLFPTRRSSDLTTEIVLDDGVAVRGVGEGVAPLREGEAAGVLTGRRDVDLDRKSTRLNSSHPSISYAVFCLKKKKTKKI